MKNGQVEESRGSRGGIVRCAKCFSYNAELLGKDGPKASRARIQTASVPKLGLNTLLLDEAIAAGPGGIRKAQHAALKFAKKYQEETIDHRAYRPDRFKSPGTNVNIGTRGDVFVLTEEQRAELRRINREYLLTAPLPGDSPFHSVTPQSQQLTNGDASQPPAAREA